MPILFAVLFLPLLSFFTLIISGKQANRWAGVWAVAVTFIGLFLSFLLTYHFLYSSQLFTFHWLLLKSHTYTLSIQLDNLALLMLILVHLVALLVQIFSISYMHHDEGRWRYFAFLGLFVFSMLMIVLAGNLLLMYIGWELVGLSSYLLIGFWYQKPRAVWAAKKAFLLNRIGDAGFLMGILMLFWLFNTTTFSDLSLILVNNSGSSSIGSWHSALGTTIGLFLFCGAMGKSAQFPLSAWLPDAMEGPTPVSALIHAATMVAAGIFLLARIHFLLTPDALMVITLIGTITMALGAYRAIFQNDIKKLLAFSTISQLGLMVVGMGVGASEASLFHLLTHAFFKAGLFLCAGAVIHAIHTQDMRQMGGLRRAMPATFVAYTLCGAALAGLPFFSGFLSKDIILVEVLVWAQQRGGAAYLIPFVCLFSAGLTAFYITRQWRMVFFGKKIDYTSATLKVEITNPDQLQHNDRHVSHFQDADGWMKLPMFVLASLSVFIWFSWNPLDASHGWFFQLFKVTPSHQFHTIVASASVFVALVGLGLGYVSAHLHLSPNFVRQFAYWHNSLKLFLQSEVKKITHWFELLREHDPATDSVLFLISPLQKIANALHYFDHRVVDLIVNGFGYLTVIFAHIVGRFDRMVVDGAVNGLAWLAGFLGNRTRSLQNGQVQSYFIIMLLGVLFLLFWVLK